ncbi:DUF4276 family protein [Larkinella insperata]|uniref:DUF4276 family protein n=1 Tax=Larkinella insperata TaxID=332158 RepID=A0ABW3QLT5_9BACT|nr:DUF4276 family protein [Larkinella insperata]
MKLVKYALIAEGYSEYKFIPVYLQRMASSLGLQVKRSKIDLLKKQPSKSKVYAEAAKLGQSAFQDGAALCLIGVDLDDSDHTPEQSQHAKELKKLEGSVKQILNRYGDKIKFYVPVQAIEHWLAYQKYKLDAGKCPTNNSLESKHQDDLKALVYGDKKAKQWKMEEVTQAIAEKADFDELARQSRSFNHFHRQVVTFLSSH